MRRKKSKEEPKPESTQAPLQPAYYDAPPTAASEDQAPEASGPMEAVPAEDVAPESAETPQSTTLKPTRSGGPARRRGRGGRGRARTNTRPAVSGQEKSAETPADAKPATSVIQAPAAIANPKGTVVLAIGLPGSGKSSWFKRHNITPLSSDMLRALLFDDPTEQRFQDLVFSNLRSMLKARLIAKRPMSYVDTTNLTPHERQNWIKLAHDYGYEIQAVYFDVPLEICLERNSKRQRVVPEDIMRRMAAKLKAPEFGEGFSKITVVRVKQKE